eukprot:742974-Amphidinium_carterae.1
MVRQCVSWRKTLITLAVCLRGSASQNLADGLYLMKVQRSSTATVCSAQLDTGIPSSTGLHAQFYTASSIGGSMPDTIGVDPFLVRTDQLVNYPSIWSAWTGLSNVRDDFAARWTGGLTIRQAGTYTFATNSDDGSWVYIDGDLVVDNGGRHAMRVAEGSVDLGIGVHQLRLEFFEAGGYAGMIFLYSGPDTVEKQLLVPPCALTPAAPEESIGAGGLSAEFMYQVLTGLTPAIIASRMLAVLVIEQAGNYTFATSPDVRSILRVNESAVLEFESSGGKVATIGAKHLAAGRHVVRMELFAASFGG